MFLDKSKICEFIPHRDPFLFLDEISEITMPEFSIEKHDKFDKRLLIGTKVFSKFKVSNEMTCFDGHFPNNPILPGVLQVEMMAQTACFVFYKIVKDPKNANLQVAFASIDKAKFKNKIVPPQDLEIQVELIKTRRQILQCEGKVFCDQKLMSEMTFMASVDINLN